MATALYKCIECSKNVSSRQHAIQCEKCEEWQHRLCNTGISHTEYRLMMKGKSDVIWYCKPCKDKSVLPDEDTVMSESFTAAADSRISFGHVVNSTAIHSLLPSVLESSTIPALSESFLELIDADRREECLDTTPRTPATPSKMTSVSSECHQTSLSNGPTQIPSTNITYVVQRDEQDNFIDIDGFSAVSHNESERSVEQTSTIEMSPIVNRSNDGFQAVSHNESERSLEQTSTIEMSPIVNRSDEAPGGRISDEISDGAIPDRSFDISGRNFDQQQPIQEESLADPEVNESFPSDGQITFEEIVNGTKRGGRKLVSSDGFSYVVKKSVEKENVTYWRCSVRNKKLTCHAYVKQTDRTFERSGAHEHAADPGMRSKVKIAAKVKTIAKEDVFRPAADVVEEVMRDAASDNQHHLPKMANLARAANLHRQRLRPKDPTDLTFNIDTNFLDSAFIIGDVKVDDQRHIVLGTRHQLSHLTRLRRWYIDGTFKVVKQPFYQLLSVHGFVKRDEDVKQVPFLFCLMSRRTKKDYSEVFQRVLTLLDDPVVEGFMLDYEKGLWQAVREVFPLAQVRGCVFHWTQAVYRKVQHLGLSTAYMERRDKYQFIRKVLALPFLPAEHIKGAFEALESQIADIQNEPLHNLLVYVRLTWIDGQWDVEDWSIFRETIRTNNDVEGWHRRLNTRARQAKLPFYVLVPLLHAEAKTVDVQVRAVSENMLCKVQRKQYSNTHGKLFDIWAMYENGELTSSALLCRCSHIMGLAPSPSPLQGTDEI